jgi:hypothetical protein
MEGVLSLFMVSSRCLRVDAGWCGFVDQGAAAVAAARVVTSVAFMTNGKAR